LQANVILSLKFPLLIESANYTCGECQENYFEKALGNMHDSSQTSFFRLRWASNFIVFFLFVLGLGIRMLDLTDLPLDFNPTRQLFSAVKARGMYYQYAADVPAWQKEMAIEQWKAKADVEPPVIETIVAGMYMAFGEHLWFGRIVASLFWMVGGLALFGLARRIGSLQGAIVALAYYLFLEFGVIASRSFQPDPLMIGLILCGLWAFYRWNEEKTWKWTIVVGLLSGMAIFVKMVAVFPLLGAFALGILATRGLKQAFKDPQVWAIAILSALPTAIYMIDGLCISKELDTAMGLRFFPSLWIEPVFYIRWRNIVENTLGLGVFLLAILGIFLAKPGRDRALLAGAFMGYLLYGFALSYHISTHNYYQLPLIVFVAPSLAVVGDAIFIKLKEVNAGSIFVRTVVLAVILFGVISEMWNVRVELLKNDYRAETQRWQALGEKLGHTEPVLVLTHDYGNGLAYWGWQRLDVWPTTGDQGLRELAGKAKSFDAMFDQYTVGKQYFVVTNFKQFEAQPALMDKLFNTYPIVEQNTDYIIFDLQHQVVQH
jgi:4-amino-4-deoxy-L-arabinose transferase-like glycosyltransferase